MNIFDEFDQVFEKYKQSNVLISDQELEKIMYSYVYFSNKLEGNRLSLLQTTILLKDNVAEGNLPLKDYLEAKGHFKALKFIVSAALNNYPLSDRNIKQTNLLTLEPYWALEDAYPKAKSYNQVLGEYKVVQNKILWSFEGNEGEIIPISTPETINQNIQDVLVKVNESNAHIIKRVAFLAYNIYIHQPFTDGNKRTARLATTFLTMKFGLPLIVFDHQSKQTDFNKCLLTAHLNNDPLILENFLANEFIISMLQQMENQNNQNNTKGLNFNL
jgi:Fic family protein